MATPRATHIIPRTLPAACRGFTLIEVLIATSLLCGALTAVSQLLVASTRATTAAHRATLQTILATQKLEELLSTDAGLLPSTAGASWRHVEPGAVEYLARDGHVTGTGVTPPDDAVYIRRWSVGGLPGAAGGVTVSVSVDGLRRAADGTVDDASPWSASRAVGIAVVRGAR